MILIHVRIHPCRCLRAASNKWLHGYADAYTYMHSPIHITRLWTYTDAYTSIIIPTRVLINIIDRLYRTRHTYTDPYTSMQSPLKCCIHDIKRVPSHQYRHVFRLCDTEPYTDIRIRIHVFKDVPRHMGTLSYRNADTMHLIIQVRLHTYRFRVARPKMRIQTDRSVYI